MEFVKGFKIPLLVLGGGGYTVRNVARCWYVIKYKVTYEGVIYCIMFCLFLLLLLSFCLCEMSNGAFYHEHTGSQLLSSPNKCSTLMFNCIVA